jgi:hypothetical protein
MSLDRYDKPALKSITPELMEKWLLKNGFSFKEMYGKYGKIFTRPADDNIWRTECYVTMPVSQDLGDYANSMSMLITDIAEAQDRQANKVLEQIIASISFLEKPISVGTVGTVDMRLRLRDIAD